MQGALVLENLLGIPPPTLAAHGNLETADLSWGKHTLNYFLVGSKLEAPKPFVRCGSPSPVHP